MSEHDRGAGPQVGRPRYVDTPEFKQILDAALEQRIQAMLPELMAQVAEAHARAAAEVDGAMPERAETGAAVQGDVNFVQALALQLAELTGQGTGRIYVAPEIVERRRKALTDLKEVLIDLHARGEIPAYRLKSKVFLNMGPSLGETLIEPLYRGNARIVQATEIDWPGIPNLAMAPINQAAERVWVPFCDWVGHRGVDSPDPDEMMALDRSGVVLRGEAARVLLQNQKSSREVMGGAAEMGSDGAPAAGIRRHDAAPKQKVQVLGTLTKPVEVS